MATAREQGRVALVTGASSGIGRATSLALLGAGIHVVGMARNRERLAELGECARELPGDFLACPGDVTRADDVSQAVQQGLERFGRLDILVANAGVGLRGELVSVDWEGLESLLRTNIDGVLHSVRAAVPAMRSSGGGHIITISSVAAPLVVPYSAAYAASKAFVSSMAHSLRLELEEGGILVTDMLVGRTATEFDTRRLGAGSREAGSSLPVMRAEKVADGVLQVIRRPQRSKTLRLFDRLILLAGRLAPDLLGRMARRQYRSAFGHGHKAERRAPAAAKARPFHLAGIRRRPVSRCRGGGKDAGRCAGGRVQDSRAGSRRGRQAPAGDDRGGPGA